MLNLQDKLFTELLIKVKSLITETYVIKYLQSENIKMSVSDQCTKNCVLN